MLGDLFNLYPRRHQVVVNTKTDRAFRGVLWRKQWDYLVLRNAEIVRNREGTVAIDGEVVIDRANVDFIQVLR